jgi:hypothetical protein
VSCCRRPGGAATRSGTSAAAGAAAGAAARRRAPRQRLPGERVGIGLQPSNQVAWEQGDRQWAMAEHRAPTRRHQTRHASSSAHQETAIDGAGMKHGNPCWQIPSSARLAWMSLQASACTRLPRLPTLSTSAPPPPGNCAPGRAPPGGATPAKHTTAGCAAPGACPHTPAHQSAGFTKSNPTKGALPWSRPRCCKAQTVDRHEKANHQQCTSVLGLSQPKGWTPQCHGPRL